MGVRLGGRTPFELNIPIGHYWAFVEMGASAAFALPPGPKSYPSTNQHSMRGESDVRPNKGATSKCAFGVIRH